MPKATLDELIAGNRRYLAKEHKVLPTQSPKASILACADSRVPPEMIFDQGLGDLFVVRVAGNVAAPTIIDSLIFGATVLKIPLIVVLGHQHCGAIQAALDGTPQLTHLGPYLEMGVQNPQCPSVKGVTLANIRKQVHVLREEPTLGPLVQAGTLDVVGAYYDLEEGVVHFLSEA